MCKILLESSIYRSINDVEISRRHCHLIFKEGDYEIEDLGSTNGTFVNEKKISVRTNLVAGDVIRLGDNVSLIFGSVSELTKKNIVTGSETPPRGQKVVESMPPPRSEPAPPTKKLSPMAIPPASLANDEDEKKRPNMLLIGWILFVTRLLPKFGAILLITPLKLSKKSCP